MDGQVYLEIKDPNSLITFLTEAKKKTGMLKDVSLEDVKKSVSRIAFPIRIPISLDGVLKLCTNPVLKMKYGKTVEDTTKKYLKATLGLS